MVEANYITAARAERGIELALESARVLDSLLDHEIKETHTEVLKADHDEDYEQEPEEDNLQLEQLIKRTLVAAVCFIMVYSGIVWYDKHQQVARELETVPPPPTATTGSILFDIDKTSNYSPQLNRNSPQVSLQSAN